jgi:23S rRNA (uracil1939-C5)-methyltransferase
VPGVPGEVIVVDPPRGGLAREVVERMALRAPTRIVYVSCDPPTLGRDLRRLQDGGYHVTDCVALDLFPNTFHVETVACLDRAEACARR